MTNEEAIKRLKEGEPFSELYNKMWEEALNMAIKALEDSRWIPVTERLPEALVDVLVTNGDFVHCSWIRTDGTWFCGCDGDLKVTAWMPFPNPYKEGE